MKQLAWSPSVVHAFSHLLNDRFVSLGDPRVTCGKNIPVEMNPFMWYTQKHALTYTFQERKLTLSAIYYMKNINEKMMHGHVVTELSQDVRHWNVNGCKSCECMAIEVKACTILWTRGLCMHWVLWVDVHMKYVKKSGDQT